MNLRKFLHKISKDLLISLLITYVFLLIPELILPGIVSSHFSVKYILLLILAVGLVYSWLGKYIPAPKENIRFGAISRNLSNILLVIIGLMLILSLYKMKFWQIAIVTIFSIFLIIATQKFLLDEKSDA
jgi:hypothetical protein